MFMGTSTWGDKTPAVNVNCMCLISTSMELPDIFS